MAVEIGFQTRETPHNLPQSALKDQDAGSEVCTALDGVLTNGSKFSLSSNDIGVLRPLRQAWIEAEIRFYKETNLHLYDPGLMELSYLQQWAAEFDKTKSLAHRGNTKWLSLVIQISDTLRSLGDAVFPLVQPLFGPAEACHVALNHLTGIPRRIQSVEDAMILMFEEVEAFLVQFKIYTRMDNKLMLDIEIRASVCRLLLSFVNLCISSIKIVKHRATAILKAVIFDDTMLDELSQFRRHAGHLQSLTATFTYEHIVKVETIVARGFSNVAEIGEVSQQLVKATTESKLRRLNSERLHVLEMKLFTKTERELWRDINHEMKVDEDASFWTDEIALSEEMYNAWEQSTSAPPIICFTGRSGSGRSFVMKALRRRLMGAQTNLSSSFYVGHHIFGSKCTKAVSMKAKVPSLIPFALRSMALQIAQQCPSYASKLSEALKQSPEIRETNQVSKIWKLLDFAHIEKSSNHVKLYLLFDGLEKESETRIDDLMDIFLASANKVAKIDSIQIRVAVSGDSRLKLFPDRKMTKIDLNTVNKKVFHAFVEQQMKDLDILQDVDSKSAELRHKIMKQLTDLESGDFNLVKRILKRIQTAINEDQSSSEIDTILRDTAGRSGSSKAHQTIRKMESTLKAMHLLQINQMISWILYSQSVWAMELAELETVIRMNQNHDSLIRLGKKVSTVFAEIFERVGTCVLLRPGIEVALRESEHKHIRLNQQKPVVNFNLSVSNVDPSIARTVVDKLNTQLKSEVFELCTTLGRPTQTIYPNIVQGHLSIINTCLELLNDDWTSERKPLTWYACQYLPKHLFVLRELYEKDESCVTPEEKRMIGQGLVGFLDNPEHLCDYFDQDLGIGDYWLAESRSVDAIRFWLRISKKLLQPHERRWVDSVTKASTNKVLHMFDVAKVLGQRWAAMDLPQYGSQDAIFNWLRVYLAKSNLTNLHSTPRESLNNGLIPKIEEHLDSVEITQICDWLRENRIKLPDEDGLHMKIGYAYGSMKDHSSAFEHFQAAHYSSEYGVQALIGMAFANRAAGIDKDSCKYMLEAFEAHKSSRKDHESEKDVGFLTEFAELLEQLGRYDEAIDCRERILSVQYSNQHWWSLLTLLCKADREDDALQKLTKLGSKPNEHSLSSRICETVDEEPLCERIIRFIHEIRNPKLNDVVTSAFVNAETLNVGNTNLPIKFVLSYLRSLAAATRLDIYEANDTEQWLSAFNGWKEVLKYRNLADTDDYTYQEIMHIAARSLACCAFDVQRFDAQTPGKLPQTFLEIVAESLHTSIRRWTQGLRLWRTGSLNHPICYAYALDSIRGKSTEARKYASDDLQLGFDILCDETVENDVAGIVLLLRAFCFVGEEMNALSVFSLLDRGSSINRNGNLGYNYVMEQPCAGCSKINRSSDPSGSWWCQFCPDLQLCQDCYSRFSSRKLRLHVCDSSHIFIHLRHGEYSSGEKVADGQIRVEWDWATKEGKSWNGSAIEGKTYLVREGGKVVDIKDWKASLEKSWELSASERGTRERRFSRTDLFKTNSRS